MDGVRSTAGDDPSSESITARTFSPAEVRELRERAAQARETARRAAAKYVELCAITTSHVSVSETAREAARVACDETREAVARYAIVLKVLGTSPERTLRLVKEAVREDIPTEIDHSQERPFMEQVVLWCIESYYRESPAA
jgi:hypothetical protein